MNDVVIDRFSEATHAAGMLSDIETVDADEMFSPKLRENDRMTKFVPTNPRLVRKQSWPRKDNGGSIALTRPTTVAL